MVQIAVVAAACEYPDARTPHSLWENSLFGRQAFRRLPVSRLAIGPYLRGDDDPDSLYSIEAGLIEGYVFDRERFLVPSATYRATDLTHWLALDVADRAISRLPGGGFANSTLKDRTGVIVANTLTGEFSRAGLLRYRWPFIEHQARRAAQSHLSGAELESYLSDLEQAIKAPFPAPDSDSLAGSLSNTIAGRIANHFGLRGGAYAVDGACASSLVGVVTACERLRGGELHCALVGAVDLSLDPFELVGFARNGALARHEMRVFDRDSEGFWPGEGCGVVVLATAKVVNEMQWPVLGWLRGTGMSGDGHGGLTRPTSTGQLLALRRAWAMAGVDPARADYFEAHGTGTPTGDPIEILALAELVADGTVRSPIPVGSVKTNIGHTKAAAGMAGLIKALAIGSERIIPPTAGHRTPHAVLASDGVRGVLSVPTMPEIVGHDEPMWLGVNSFGFGGINCHVVVQGPSVALGSRVRPPRIACSSLRGELIALSAESRAELCKLVEQIQRRATTLSRAELIDMASSERPAGGGGWRACIIASLPQDLETSAAALLASLEAAGSERRAIETRWAWSAPAEREPRLAFLFSGQAAPTRVNAEPWSGRFSCIAESAERVALSGEPSCTSVVQPLLAEVAIASVELLHRLGLQPHAVIGHSFGELSALFAAGAFNAATFRTLASNRGRVMRDFSPPGAMLAVEVDRALAQTLAEAHGVEVACLNAPEKHVLAGSSDAIDALAAACWAAGVTANRLPTERAFHSRLMQSAQLAFMAELAELPIGAPAIPVASTITGRLLGGDSLPLLLTQQFTAPVRFADALVSLGEVDLLIELGGGAGLGGLIGNLGGPSCLAAPVFGPVLEPLLAAVGAWWVCGGTVDTDLLYAERMVRKFRLHDEAIYFTNPCAVDHGASALSETSVRASSTPQIDATWIKPSTDALGLLQGLICDVAGLPLRTVNADSRLLADLHLNSIRARHVIAAAARQLGIVSLPFSLGDIANASVGDVAGHLDSLRAAQTSAAKPATEGAPGIEPWLALLSHRWQERQEATSDGDTRHFRVGPAGADLPQALRELATNATDAPTLLHLSGNADDALEELVAEARRLVTESNGQGLLVLQSAAVANGFLQSMARELPAVRLCAIEYELLDRDSLQRAAAEFYRSPRGYSELRLRGSCAHSRSVAVLPLAATAQPHSLGMDDVVLITGGAKGIGAATARFIASTYGCRLALVGRSDVSDAEVLTTLAALAQISPQIAYVQADLSEASASHRAICEIESKLGPVTALVHSAGLNHPVALRDLTQEQARATVAAKVHSLDHLLCAITVGQLKLVVAFASIIGEFGLPGEAHYALANEWMAQRTLAYSSRSPSTRCVPIAWTAWREIGMASRLDGVLEGLSRADTRAIDTGEALGALRAILESNHDGEVVIVTGRYGRTIDATNELPELHRHRYLELPRVFYPGIELVADAELSTDTDRYLLDHAPYGLPVFPLVAAIEAMVSAARGVHPVGSQLVIHDLRIGDAVTLSLGERIVIRTSALRRNDGSIIASVRSSTTEFEVDHFTCVFRCNTPRVASEARRLRSTECIPAAPLLYAGLSFHGPRFQRVAEYYELGALYCMARTRAVGIVDWFGPYQSRTLIAGDPAIRDAVLHALQVCIPQHTVLPVGVARVEIGELRHDAEYIIAAHQRHGDGSEFVFDVEVVDAEGGVVERWIGLRLALVPMDSGDRTLRCDIDVALLESFAGRLLLDEIGETEWSVGVCTQDGESSSQRAVRRAVGPTAELTHTESGLPQIQGTHISISHTDEVTLAIAHQSKHVACDIEHQPELATEAWRLLLGDRRWTFTQHLARDARLAPETVGLVVWAASECLSKLDRADWPFEARAVLVSEAPKTGPIVQLVADGLRVVVGVLQLRGHERPSALAIGLLDASEADRRLAGDHSIHEIAQIG